MHSCDDILHIKQTGWLSFLRCRCPEEGVVEEVAVTLHTPTDPTDRCVGSVRIEWVPGRLDALEPRLKAEGSNLKVLALFPEILAPFHEMKDGRLSPDDFINGLLLLGVKPTPHAPVPAHPASMTCPACSRLFAVAGCCHSHPMHGSVVCRLCSLLAEHPYPDIAVGVCHAQG